MLMVAYGESQSDRLQLHHPEVCYTAQGFRVSGTSAAKLDYSPSAPPLKMTRLVAQREDRIEPISYWMRIGYDNANSNWTRQALKLGYGLRGWVPDGVLFRVSTLGVPAELSFKIQDKFIRDLLNSVDPRPRNSWSATLRKRCCNLGQRAVKACHERYEPRPEMRPSGPRNLPRSTTACPVRYSREAPDGVAWGYNGDFMERIWLKSYPKGVPSEIDASAVGSLADLIKASFEKFRDRTAFVSMGKAMSYGELDLKSRAFATYLRNVARLPSGARVALMLPNLLQYPVAAFGALRAGYVVVNSNPLYSPRELKNQLADFGAEAIVVLENFANTLEKAIEGTAVKVVIVTGAGDQLGGLNGTLVNSVVRHVRRAVPAWRLPQAVRFNRALALGWRSPFADAPISPDDLAFLQYTGGTTGVPKGAMLTHRNMVANLRQIYAWLAPAIHAEGEMFVAALPLYHVFALQVNGFVPLMIGASNFMIANPRDIPALVKALRGAPFTAIPGVNTLFNALLNNKDFAKLDFSRLHLAIGGGMAVQRAVAERWQSTTGKPLIEAYGLTETSPGAIANPLTIDHFTGAIGLPMPSTDIAIRDDEGRDLELGEAGELCIKGPQVMAGYWNRPDETAKVMTADGFLPPVTSRGSMNAATCSSSTEEGHDQCLRLQRLSERG